MIEADRNDVCRLTKDIHEEGIFREIEFSENKFNGFFSNTLNNPQNYLGLKVERDGRVLGCSYCMIGGYFIGDGARIVTVNTICVDKPIRASVLGGKVALKLVRGIEAWARNRDADAVLFHVTSGKGLNGIDRFFRKIGMTTLGGNYGVRLK